MTKQQHGQSIKDIYYNPRIPGSYGGVKSLAKTIGKSKKVTKDWLQTQDTYTLHKTIRRKFPRRKVIVGGPNQQFQADLIDLQQFKKKNKGFSYLLTLIDVFSKFAYVLPLQNKNGNTLLDAFQNLFASGFKTLSLQTDRGKEFINKKVQRFLKDQRVHFFTTQNDDIKASIVERFNRTLKDRMFRYLTHNETNRYIDILPDLVESYNNTYHRSIKMAPSNVDKTNKEEVWQTLYGNFTNETPKILFREGDRVRISKVKKTFEKGYLPSWTGEMFTIYDVQRKTTPPVYRLKDDNGEVLEGTFYQQELQKIAHKEVYRVSRILKERQIRGQKQYLVEWFGYPASFNSWIPSSHMQSYG